MSGKPSILFACKANAGRSVTGNVLAAHYAGAAVDVFSAGSEPVDMSIRGRCRPQRTRPDHRRRVPQGLDPDGSYTAVITMGCGEACLFYPGAHYEDWELDDAKGQDEKTVRGIDADIDRRVRRLLGELVPDLRLPPSVFNRSDAK